MDSKRIFAVRCEVRIDLAQGWVPTSAIRTKLALGPAQWLFFEPALRLKPDEQGLAVVATNCEHSLKVLDGPVRFDHCFMTSG